MNQISGINECNHSLLYIIVISHCTSCHQQGQVRLSASGEEHLLKGTDSPWERLRDIYLGNGRLLRKKYVESLFATCLFSPQKNTLYVTLYCVACVHFVCH